MTKKKRLLACEGGAGRITALDVDGKVVEIIASEYEGKRFNSPNDLVIDSKGGIYFTDPTWDPRPPQKQNGVYYRSKDGAILRLIDDMDKPNGILLSPDGSILYVDDSNSMLVRAYDVNTEGVHAEGVLSNRRSFVSLRTKPGSGTAVADGMAMDVHGRLYITTDTGIQIFNRNGASITTIDVPEQPANCTFGGPDMNILYITAQTGLYAIRLNTVGLQYLLRELNGVR